MIGLRILSYLFFLCLLIYFIGISKNRQKILQKLHLHDVQVLNNSQISMCIEVVHETILSSSVQDCNKLQQVRMDKVQRISNQQGANRSVVQRVVSKQCGKSQTSSHFIELMTIFHFSYQSMNLLKLQDISNQQPASPCISASRNCLSQFQFEIYQVNHGYFNIKIMFWQTQAIPRNISELKLLEYVYQQYKFTSNMIIVGNIKITKYYTRVILQQEKSLNNSENQKKTQKIPANQFSSKSICRIKKYLISYV